MNVDTLKKISPAWWGAVAGAVVAGATILPDARILGGLGAGVAMFLLARKASGPCCAGCADASRSPVAQDSTEPAPALESTVGALRAETEKPCCEGMEALLS